MMRKNQLLRRLLSYTLILLIFTHTTGCMYLQVKEATPEDLVKLLSKETIKDYFILHGANAVYTFSEITATKQDLSGELEKIRMDYKPYHYKVDRRTKIHGGETSVFNEVHIYTSRDIDIGEIVLNEGDIDAIKIIDQNTGATIFAAVGTLALTFLVLLVLIIALKSSCPFIYVNDGETFVFQGESFGGAIFPNLERNDYMPLTKLVGEDGVYKVQISNQLKEKQYTNLAQLLAINHPPNTSILLDQNGNPHLICALQSPVTAISGNQADLLQLLSKKDQNYFLFNELEGDKSEAVVKFRKPIGASDGNLVLKAKNSMWFDYLFGEFTENFGAYYEKWIDKQSERPRKELEQEIAEKNFLLNISVKTDTGWELIERLPMVGPLADRELVVNLPFDNISSGIIEVKIETGFFFWELDYVGLAAKVDQPIESVEIHAEKLLYGGNQNTLSDILHDDDAYLEQFVIGQTAELHFPIPTKKMDQRQTVFLHTKGYYTHIRAYKGLPNIVELMKFNKQDYFSTYSRSRYKEFYEETIPKLLAD